MNELVIFDMDGLLVDSEPLQCEAYLKACKKHGIKMTKKDFILDFTKYGFDIYDYLKKHYPKMPKEKVKEVGDKIRADKKKVYDTLIESTLKLKLGALDLLKDLSGKIPLTLASSSRIESINLILKRFELEKYFMKVLSAMDLENKKPHPEVFLKAAEGIATPEKCVVIEDATKGLLAAKAGGMKCIICPDPYTIDEDFSSADLIVDSLKELNHQIIGDL